LVSVLAPIHWGWGGWSSQSWGNWSSQHRQPWLSRCWGLVVKALGELVTVVITVNVIAVKKKLTCWGRVGVLICWSRGCWRGAGSRSSSLGEIWTGGGCWDWEGCHHRDAGARVAVVSRLVTCTRMPARVNHTCDEP